MNLTHKLKKPADFVFAHLTDMQKFAAVHPVIYKINRLDGNTYLIFEKLKIGFIPYSFTYTATVESHSANKMVLLRANVMNLATIEMHFAIKASGSGCIVSETITFESALPVKAIMKPVFRKQHTRLFLNIEQAAQ